MINHRIGKPFSTNWYFIRWDSGMFNGSDDFDLEMAVGEYTVDVRFRWCFFWICEFQHVQIYVLKSRIPSCILFITPMIGPGPRRALMAFIDGCTWVYTLYDSVSGFLMYRSIEHFNNFQHKSKIGHFSGMTSGCLQCMWCLFLGEADIFGRGPNAEAMVDPMIKLTGLPCWGSLFFFLMGVIMLWPELLFLMSSHQNIVITGGLSPVCDLPTAPCY